MGGNDQRPSKKKIELWYGKLRRSFIKVELNN
jgi:hypothetical protein